MDCRKKRLIDHRKLKEIISIESYYISELGPPKKRDSKNLTYFCPFHSDGKNPNLKVSVGGKYPGFFKCFSPKCTAKGDIITLYQKLHNLTFPQAIQELARLYAPEVLND